MKILLHTHITSRTSRHLHSSPFRFAVGAALAAFLILFSSSIQAQLLTDDFSDGNDTLNPTWTHLSGYVNSTGQAWLVGGGTNPPAAYRLLAPSGGINGFGFVGSHTGPSIADVRVETDFINFFSPGVNPAFGVAARLNGNNTTLGLTGYGYAYEPFAASGQGEMVLYYLDNTLVHDIGSQAVTLDPAKDYRFVLEIVGTSLHGQVCEIGGGMVAERFATDSRYASGSSGVFGYTTTGFPDVDFTVDNFAVTAVPEPGVSLLMGLGVVAFIFGRRAWQKRS